MATVYKAQHNILWKKVWWIQHQLTVKNNILNSHEFIINEYNVNADPLLKVCVCVCVCVCARAHIHVFHHT